MDANREAVARACLAAAYDGSLSFPEIIEALLDVGFEGYTVDYRTGTQTYYLPDGDHVALTMPHSARPIAALFDVDRVGALVRWAQANATDYSYKSFCDKVRAAGCAGYFVSFPGRRVVYYGRTAETHVEQIPQGYAMWKGRRLPVL